MAESAHVSTEAAGSAACVEPLARRGSVKENQSRDSSLSMVSPRTATLAIVEGVDGTVANTLRPVSKQQLTTSISPSRVNSAQIRDPASLASPSRSYSQHLRGCENGSGHPPVARRSPIRVGYLFKQSSGTWKRKRWNQRWFVLDNETGVLKYFRHESLPEAVPFRQDSHGMIYLKEPGASLVIQGDLPRNVPTPFCFTVCDASRSFLICADSNQDFREWTSAISAILSPRKTTTPEGAPPVPTGTSPKRAATDSALDSAVAFARPVPTAVVARESLAEPKSPTSLQTCIGYENLEAEIRPTLRQTVAALLVINSLFAIVRYGSVQWLCVSLLGMNTYLVWMLWFQKPTSRNSQQPEHGSDSYADDSSPDTLGSLPPGSPRAINGSKSPRGADSPRKQTLPRLEKLPSAAFQPTNFLGVVDGVKVKAGDSVKMCPPAPAAFVAGCWTQISGTRFQVRQGPNYRKTKLKALSDESLLDLAAVDIYRSPSKIDHIASIIDLGELKPENGPLDLFIVNCQVPSYQPSNPLWGEKQGNGEGFNFVSFFAIPTAIREQLNQHEPAKQAVRLLKNFMQDNSSVRDRFKAIGIVVNPQEQKLGRTERHLLETYNGQPILTRPQHRFYRGDGYFEVDVDAHEFNFVARKGLVGVSEHFRNMVVDFGYVIEGQEDAELPEQMLGAVRLCKIDVRQALEIS